MVVSRVLDDTKHLRTQKVNEVGHPRYCLTFRKV